MLSGFLRRFSTGLGLNFIFFPVFLTRTSTLVGPFPAKDLFALNGLLFHSIMVHRTGNNFHSNGRTLVVLDQHFYKFSDATCLASVKP